MADETDVDFVACWQAALEAYGHPGVEAACLALQDDYGLDVIVILTLGWLAARRTGLSDPGLDALVAAARPWQEGVVKPLRELRRRLKSEGDPAMARVYDSLKKSELEAERSEMEALLAALARIETSTGDDPADSSDLIAHYAARAGVSLDKMAANYIRTIAQAYG